MALDENLQKVRVEIIHSMLTALSVFAPIAVLGSLSRVMTIGWKPVMLLQIAAVSTVMLVSVFRHRFSLSFKAACVIGLLMITSIGGIIQFGLLSTMIVTMAIAPSFALVFFGRRSAIAIGLFSVTAFSLIGWYTVATGTLPELDLSVYLTSPLAWTNAALTMLLITAFMLLVHERYSHHLIKNLVAEQQQQLLLQELTVQKRFSDMFYRHSAMMLLTDPQSGAIIDANLAVERYVGYSRDRLLHMSTVDIMVLRPEDLQKAHQDTALGQKGNFIINHRIASGELRTVDVHATPIFHNNKTLLFSIIQDVTDQRLAEEKLRASEELFRSLFVNSPVAYLSLDETGIFIDMNPEFCTLLGYQRDELLGHRFDEVWAEGQRQRFPSTFATFVAQGCVSAELQLLQRDGPPLTVLLEGRVQRDLQNKFMRTHCMLYNITARKQREDELRKLSRAVEQSPITIVITDTDGTIEFVNPRFTEMTGYCLEEVIGQNPRVFKSGQSTPEHYRRLWETIGSGKVWEGEFLNKGKQGRLFWEQARIAPIFDEHGVITHYLALKEDITEKKQIMEQLQHAKDEAERASQAKGAFLATMSHEIRTPMNGMIGMTAALLENELTDEQRELAEIVQRSAESLMSLINNVLDSSKLESGKLVLELMEIDLRQLVQDTALLFSWQAKEAGLHLSCTFDPALPGKVKGDPCRLKQILINLLGNAFKFTPSGSITITVRQTSSENGRCMIQFEVKDTGIGIPDNRQSAIFEQFTQADSSTTRKFGGSGLGLSICQQLAQLMGGSVGVESQVGVGSTFWFSTCFETVAVVDTASGSVAGGQKNDTPKLRRADELPVRVLLAEDEPINQKVALRMLGKLGCVTDLVTDGQQAVQTLEEKMYDLVLMDCHMPGIDGLEATALIRASRTGRGNPQVPIIALTGDAMQEQREKCLAAGMNDFLTKPVRKEEAARVMARWLTDVTYV